MLKRINWKKVLFILTWVLCLGGLVSLMSFISVKKTALQCREIKIIIPGTSSFIDRNDVSQLVKQNAGVLVGMAMDRINIHAIEKALKSNPYIRAARVFADMDGVLHIEVEQRQPVLRILNYSNQDFYIDQEGYKIPSSINYTPNVLVANGYIMESFSGTIDTLRTPVAKDLFKAATFMGNDPLWKDQIEQMYVNEQKEIEMIPRVGNHKIILGTADSLEVKLGNLLIFYKKAIPAVGWDAYKTINIKYSNQIVCEKSMSDSNQVKAPATSIPHSDSAKNSDELHAKAEMKVD